MLWEFFFGSSKIHRNVIKCRPLAPQDNLKNVTIHNYSPLWIQFTPTGNWQENRTKLDEHNDENASLLVIYLPHKQNNSLINIFNNFPKIVNFSHFLKNGFNGFGYQKWTILYNKCEEKLF